MALAKTKPVFTLDDYLKIDRSEKFHRYQLWNPTLTDYILVSQDKPLVEHYIRQTDGSWKYYFYEGWEREFSIESINSRLKLADVFYRIEFEEKLSDY